ncbi:MAG: tryptophan--tRNA ligase [Candidatus ainarchaeum sp.]|jgi:tryptophanyl-tRNA synthetase|nr:tryptophan--tRNA ligase [Candidatus ainarchaeum sp.]MDD3086155.1 tryptophan--tRNA ligase [Candidatus ainarchaeum sp.]MDD4128808.1 tryptophan--tRNA ligase [Candidatus ainarchaeum sp.]MDD4467729.1 tryptophan--tRNA ligase [Candidatus ainarchaeum sp.]HPM85763.1 tryptophan--tRNA ligase [archaeon]
MKEREKMSDKIIVDPWGKELVEDYSRLIKEFGMKEFDAKMLPNPNLQMRRGVNFGGTDLEQIASAIQNKKPFYALSGIMPSSEKIHLGTETVIQNIKYFQEQGAKTFVLIADVESQATRGIPIEEGKKRALEFHIPAYIALGLDPNKTNFYLQSENKKVSNLAVIASQKITENEFRAIYGSLHPSKIMSAFTQVGDILYPQLEERMPGVIPVGIDQAPHIRMVRDVARRLKANYEFFLPSALYNKYTSALDGSFKMSKSGEEKAKIEIPEKDLNLLAKKINKALTGGRVTIEEQRTKGGEITKCVVYEYCKNHFIKDDKILKQMFEECISGKNLCKECKAKYGIPYATKFYEDFNEKFIKAKKQINLGKINFVE